MPGAPDTTKVGITGHRVLFDLPAVRVAVDEAFDSLTAHGRTAIEVWSSLADGADRLVVHRAMARPQTTLVVVLPLAPDDYRTDFDAASSAEFDALLARAARVEVTGPDAGGTRESAYERAGLAVVEGCDVLLALWDGEASRGRGGTAEIVAAARARGRDVVVIPVERPS